jgi:GTPase SAR1 family protein
MKEVEKHSGEDVSIMVLANKADMEDEIEVSDAEIKKFEEEYKLKVIKTSAKSGANVDESFLDITKKLIVKKNNSGSQNNPQRAMGLKKLKDGLENGGTPGSSGNGCC